MQEKVGSKRFSKKKGDREKNERDEGLGQRGGNMNEKQMSLWRRTNMTKSHGKSGESTAYYLFGILDAGVRWEMPYLNRENFEKRNKRNISSI